MTMLLLMVAAVAMLSVLGVFSWTPDVAPERGKGGVPVQFARETGGAFDIGLEFQSPPGGQRLKLTYRDSGFVTLIDVPAGTNHVSVPRGRPGRVTVQSLNDQGQGVGNPIDIGLGG